MDYSDESNRNNFQKPNTWVDRFEGQEFYKVSINTKKIRIKQVGTNVFYGTYPQILIAILFLERLTRSLSMFVVAVSNTVWGQLNAMDRSPL